MRSTMVVSTTVSWEVMLLADCSTPSPATVARTSVLHEMWNGSTALRKTPRICCSSWKWPLLQRAAAAITRTLELAFSKPPKASLTALSIFALSIELEASAVSKSVRRALARRCAGKVFCLSVWWSSAKRSTSAGYFSAALLTSHGAGVSVMTTAFPVGSTVAMAYSLPSCDTNAFSSAHHARVTVTALSSITTSAPREIFSALQNGDSNGDSPSSSSMHD
mmetsp:Transcript_51048/g.116229  ORF Transcript_51048/g.116229 Transcript_51048/m.116229 type:complete len:221 (+) Transcript_51048:161-823(+)